jgi:hypothetical protein
MCLVSEKIKFCTCVTDSVDKLNNYWILYRFDKTKDDCIVGMPSMPPEWGDPNFVINNHTLEVRLNEPDAFDIPIKFKAKDQFEIVFNNHSKNEENRLTYCFIFKNGKWIQEEYDVFELMNRYEEFTFGKMKKIKKKQN